jgi:hypothetical protein
MWLSIFAAYVLRAHGPLAQIRGVLPTSERIPAPFRAPADLGEVAGHHRVGEVEHRAAQLAERRLVLHVFRGVEVRGAGHMQDEPALGELRCSVFHLSDAVMICASGPWARRT